MRRVPRSEGHELMDLPDVAPAGLRQALADLRRANRWLGGAHAAMSVLLPLVRRVAAAEVTVLDVATGSADIPLTLVRRAQRRGSRVRVVATDLHEETLAAAREHVAAVGTAGVEVARADALDLPYDGGQFHVAMCHTALHHFDPPDACRLLAELARVASHGIVVTDLSRSRVGFAGILLAARTLWRRHPVTRHDSVVSLRSAYTPVEVAQLARFVGLQDVRIREHPFFRFSLVARGGDLPG